MSFDPSDKVVKLGCHQHRFPKTTESSDREYITDIISTGKSSRYMTKNEMAVMSVSGQNLAKPHPKSKGLLTLCIGV